MVDPRGHDHVPSGTYEVLVAFENDMLVCDPDEGIAGTASLEITVEAGQPLDLQDSFKATETLEVFGLAQDRGGGERLYISRTEDLRGVFVTGEAEPAGMCEEDTGGADSGSSGG